VIVFHHLQMRVFGRRTAIIFRYCHLLGSKAAELHAVLVITRGLLRMTCAGVGAEVRESFQEKRVGPCASHETIPVQYDLRDPQPPSFGNSRLETLAHLLVYSIAYLATSLRIDLPIHQGPTIATWQETGVWQALRWLSSTVFATQYRSTNLHFELKDSGTATAELYGWSPLQMLPEAYFYRPYRSPCHRNKLDASASAFTAPFRSSFTSISSRPTAAAHHRQSACAYYSRQ
jgi:hypothetical protein